MGLKFSEKTEAAISGLLTRYPTTDPALIPVLTLAANEFGAVTDEVIDLVAARLALPPPKVLATATFYTMIPKQPVGRHHVQVCTNIACSLLGSEHILSMLEKKLGVAAGGTTADGRFTLSEVECLGSCGSAPVMMVNETFYENLDEQAVDRVLEECRRG